MFYPLNDSKNLSEWPAIPWNPWEPWKDLTKNHCKNPWNPLEIALTSGEISKNLYEKKIEKRI